ncbi:MAG: hypothetical protein Q9211_005246 [Gyalolechia sp. 1 TL-2023]
MADRAREERVMTVYADVHYYFNAPTPRPLSHRFDKGSYLYLYRNKDDRGGRLEIANYVGKPEQDAFTGSMYPSSLHPKREADVVAIAALDSVKVHHASSCAQLYNPTP